VWWREFFLAVQRSVEPRTRVVTRSIGGGALEEHAGAGPERADLVERGVGGRGRGFLHELGQTRAAGSLGAVHIALSVRDHIVLQGAKVECREAQAVLLVELGLLLALL
jgi:hypothetical protein